MNFFYINETIFVLPSFATYPAKSYVTSENKILSTYKISSNPSSYYNIY